MLKLTGRTALITGGGTGIGKEIGKLFAANGANVAICGRRIEQLNIAKSEIERIGGKCIAIAGDVSNEENVINIVDNVIGNFNRIDVLVNNASVVGQVAPVKDIILKEWEETIRINLTGTLLCSREVIKKMIEQKCGNIINISSNVSKRGEPNRAPYVCSKWAMNGLTQTLALEVAEYNIRVNAICPGPVLTDRLKGAMEKVAATKGITVEELFEIWKNQSPMKRFVTVDECAKVALFLACDDSSGMTGQAINVSAGMIMI